MNRKKYNRSFARRLTQWVMLVLFIMMSALGYLIYKLAKSVVVEMSADAYHADMLASASTITGMLANAQLYATIPLTWSATCTNPSSCRASWNISSYRILAYAVVE